LQIGVALGRSHLGKHQHRIGRQNHHRHPRSRRKSLQLRVAKELAADQGFETFSRHGGLNFGRDSREIVQEAGQVAHTDGDDGVFQTGRRTRGRSRSGGGLSAYCHRTQNLQSYQNTQQ
jgi:hypothetical protein